MSVYVKTKNNMRTNSAPPSSLALTLVIAHLLNHLIHHDFFCVFVGNTVCREHAQQLTRAFAAKNNTDDGNHASNRNCPTLWGVVKETGVDDGGLTEFYQDYFAHQDLYLDETMATYQALGLRKIKITTWNPFKWIRAYLALRKRLKQARNLKGNMKGEGLVQGGIILLDAEGHVRYARVEETGTPLDIEELQVVVDALFREATTANTDN